MSPLFLAPVFAVWWWPFASGLMLLWGISAAAPIIIHLWNQRRYRETTWAAMEFLLAAMRKNARRIRIEQLILLAVRTAILLLFAAALADPILSLFSSLGAALGQGGSTHWVLVIDGSYSMDYRRGEQSRFDEVKALANKLIDQSTQGDGFTLVLMSDPPRVVIREPAFAANDVREELDSLRLPHGGGDLSTTLAEVERIMVAAQDKYPRLATRKVCLFTDLGRTTWDEAASAACRARVGKLAELAKLILLDVGEIDQQNLAVTRFAPRESLVTASRDVTFEAEVQNFNGPEQSQRKVEFVVDGRVLRDESVDVAAGGRTNVAFTHRFDAPGEHSVEVRLAADPLEIDNHRYLSVPVRESIRVLCIGGREGGARHVSLALEPTRSDRPRVRPEVAPESAVLEADLADYDCVFLCNVGRFGRDEAGVLYDYLKNGGGLVFFLGDQVQAESYNQELGGEASKLRVLPARLEKPTPHGEYSFDPLEYRHPIVSVFRGHEQTGLLTTPVWKYIRLVPYDKDASKVALAFDGGDPAIVEERILRGRSILVATAVSAESVDRSTGTPQPWTVLSTWPSFPPLIQEMLALAVGGKTGGRNVMVGEEFGSVVRGEAAGSPLTVVGPDGKSETVRPSSDGDESRWVLSSPLFSGLYEAKFDVTSTASREERGSLPPTQLFAVNVDPVESDLTRVDPELLPSQFEQDLRSDDSEPPKLPGGKPFPMFRLVLGLVLALVFLETSLAWLFGKTSA